MCRVPVSSCLMRMRMVLVLLLLTCGAAGEEEFEVQEMGHVDSPSLKA